MDTLRQYLLSVTAAVLICSMIRKLIGEKGTAAKVGKMMTGIFLALTILRPISVLDPDWSTDLDLDISMHAAQAAENGKLQTKEALKNNISQRVKAYILEEANSLNVSLEVKLSLSDDEIPMPEAVVLTGKVSPYAKGKLQTILEKDLGIPKEKQTWK